MTTPDYDQIGRDLAEAVRLTVSAQHDVESIEAESFSSAVPLADDIENAATEATGALERLRGLLDQAYDQLPPAGGNMTT